MPDARANTVHFPQWLPQRMSALERRAALFAARRHAAVGQVRRYTGCDYITHPAEVAEIVRGVGGHEAQLAAAWLHDVVEDTGTTLAEIREHFGAQVALLVEMLTDVAPASAGNRQTRVAINRAHTAQASPDAKTIKLADLISNTQSIVQHDPAFAQRYLHEKAALLHVLTDGHAVLQEYAWLSVHVGIANLERAGYPKFEPPARELCPDESFVLGGP